MTESVLQKKAHSVKDYIVDVCVCVLLLFLCLVLYFSFLFFLFYFVFVLLVSFTEAERISLQTHKV